MRGNCREKLQNIDEEWPCIAIYVPFKIFLWKMMSNMVMFQAMLFENGQNLRR